MFERWPYIVVLRRWISSGGKAAAASAVEHTFVMCLSYTCLLFSLFSCTVTDRQANRQTSVFTVESISQISVCSSLLHSAVRLTLAGWLAVSALVKPTVPLSYSTAVHRHRQKLKLKLLLTHCEGQSYSCDLSLTVLLLVQTAVGHCVSRAVVETMNY